MPVDTSMSFAFQADAVPVGALDVRVLPWLSTATHKVVVGQLIALTEVVPSLSTLVHELLAGLVA
jgi:hypothetical protein